MIDLIRHDIQQRLDQLLAEVDKLRRALAALDPRGGSATEPKAAKPPPTAKRAAKTPTESTRTPARTPARSARAANGAAASRPSAPGQTKAMVLGALAGGQVLTAGDVATATGLARPTVSTTLSRLAKTGDVIKADRGYGLPSTNDATVNVAEPATDDA